MALIDKLKAIADAIRSKTGSVDLLKLEDMPEAIASIESGGGSKNCLPFNAESTTMENLVITVNEDKTINISGYTATAKYFTIFDSAKHGGTVTIPQGVYFYPHLTNSFHELHVTWNEGEVFYDYNVDLLDRFTTAGDINVSSVYLIIKSTKGITNTDLSLGMFKYEPWKG